jgi:hypothetical protein
MVGAMPDDFGFVCSCCGQRHDDQPMVYHAEAPIYWSGRRLPFSRSRLSSDQCVIKGEAFFIRGLVEIPVVDADDVFAWGVWVSLSKETFVRADKLWQMPGREHEPPYSGLLSTELGLYSPWTVNLKSHVHTRPVGRRPLIELEPTDHPLAVEQRTGISMERVRQIAETILHPGR